MIPFDPTGLCQAFAHKNPKPPGSAAITTIGDEMNTLSWILGFIIAGFVLAVLFGRFARVGAGQEPEQSAADQLAALQAAQPLKEDGWIAELEAGIAQQQANLAALRAAPMTVESIRACGEAVVSIEAAQEVLHMLYMRRCYSFDGTAAAHYEGRM